MINKLLVVGDGGRAYSIVNRALEDGVSKIYYIGSNVNIKYLDSNIETYEDINITNSLQILDVAKKVNPDFIIVINVESCMAGVVDVLREHGFIVFGVNKKGTILESSKTQAKRFLEKYNALNKDKSLYYPEFCGFLDKYDAINFVEYMKKPYVVKVDGLYGGRGTVICKDFLETIQTLKHVPENTPVELEEFIDGIEIAFNAFVSKDLLLPLFTIFEHKKSANNDLGTMTGEMGTLAVSGISEKVKNELIYPLTKLLEMLDYTGEIYITTIYNPINKKFYIIEFNTRFTDPLTEIGIKMIDNNFTEMLYKLAKNDNDVFLSFKTIYGCGVCAVSSGYPYPNACLNGLPIYYNKQLVTKDNFKDLFKNKIDLMSAKLDDDYLKTYGGRQLIALGYSTTSLVEAIDIAYRIIRNVSFVDIVYRTDIGERVIKNIAYLGGII